MSFLETNDDVFLLAGPQATSGPVTSLRESVVPGARPLTAEFRYAPAGKSTTALELTWNATSAARRARGDVADFTLGIRREGQPAEGDVLAIRLPIDAGATWDPVFATIVATAFKTSRSTDLLGFELGVGAGGALQFALPLQVQAVTHGSTAWRFPTPTAPDSPFLELRFHLRASDAPLEIRVGRLFAGQRYDPYAFNPAYELLAHVGGRPKFPGGAEAIAEFERQAIEASKTHAYTGMQSFVRPFLVMREGEPRFPMLVGTPNSISWYGQDPRHGIEEYHREGYVRGGDVVLDCGAHAGQMSTMFGLLAGPTGKVFAFDPFPQNYFQVEAQGRLNGLAAFESTRAGVGVVNGSLPVSINGQSTSGTYGNEQKDKIDIAILPLDDFIEARPTFVKLDVEGAEVGALHGAQKLLRACKPRMFIELHTQFIGHFGHDLTDFFEAIPSDIYDVRYKIDGVDHAWKTYEPGIEKGVTMPMLVLANPR